MRFNIGLLCGALILCGCTGLAGGQPAQAQATSASSQVTRTPYLPALPTANLPPRPTSTQAPQPTATPEQPACGDRQGEIEEHSLETIYQTETFRYRLYLPPCFDQTPAYCYPVLYMLHGQTYNDDQWERLGIGAAADSLINSGEAEPFIIVMPREDNTYGDIYRMGYPHALIKELIPLVDAGYNICPGRAYHAIGGLSRGGAWAVHLGFQNWQLFGAIGAHSTPPFDGDLSRLPGWTEAIPAEDLPRVYLDSGDRDFFHEESAALDDLLTRLQVPHEWVVHEGTHDEAYWQAHAADYLHWYAAGWNP